MTQHSATQALKLDFIGVVGWSFNAQSVQIALNTIDETEPVVINMHTPGGDPEEATAIKNMLMAHRGEVTVNILANCLSAGPILAMGADTINMAPDTAFMVHRAWTETWGNANELEAKAKQLRFHDELMQTSFSARGERLNLSSEELTSAIDAETWYTAQKALEAGFIDNVLSADQFNAPPQLNINPDELDSLALPPSAPESVLAMLGLERRKTGIVMSAKKTAPVSAQVATGESPVISQEPVITEEQVAEKVNAAKDDIHARYEALMPYASSKGMEWVKNAVSMEVPLESVLALAGEVSQPEPKAEPATVAATQAPSVQAQVIEPVDVQAIQAQAVQAAYHQTSNTASVGSGRAEGAQNIASDEDILAKAAADAEAANKRLAERYG